MSIIGKILRTNIPVVTPTVRKLWNTYAMASNTRKTKQIAKLMDCTYLEAWVILIDDFETVEEAQDDIAQWVTYTRLLKDLIPGAEQYISETYYNGADVSELPESSRGEFQYLVREHVLEQAEMFALDWKQADDYSEMSEAEKEAVIFGRLIDERRTALEVSA
jgi:hypothetical protein